MLLELKKNSLANVKLVQPAGWKCYNTADVGAFSVFIYGYPYNDDRQQLMTAQDICRHLMTGNFDPASLEGMYTIIIIERKEKTVRIITDRYGMFRLFYALDQDRLLLSDNISEIVASLPKIKLNRQSIIEFLSFGFKLGNKTHIEGINEFEAATVTTISDGLESKKNVYWNYLEQAKAPPKSFEELRQMYNKHIALAFQLGQRPVLPLSGGLDTRAIVSSCVINKRPIRCYTYSPGKTYDLNLARKICRHFGFPHDFYKLDHEWIKNIPKMLEKNIGEFNGLLPVLSYLHIIQVCENERVKSDLIIWGMLGNEIWRGHLSAYAIKNEGDDATLNILKQFGVLNAAIQNAFAEPLRTNVVKDLRAAVSQELTTGSGSGQLKDPVEMFVFRNYGANWAGKLFQFSGKYHIPFSVHLNKDILPNMPALDLADRHTGKLHKYIIRQNSKYLASLLLEPENRARGVTISPGLSARLKGKILLFIYLSSKLINLISRKILKTDLLRFTLRHDYPGWLRKYHQPYVRKILDYDSLLTKQYLNRAGLTTLIDKYFSGDDAPANFIIRLLSLELWLKKISKINNITD